MKKCIVIAAVFGSACLIAAPLSAQQSVLGKSCLGTFDTRKSTDGEYDLGAIRINFVPTMPLKATTEIAPGIHLIALVSNKPTTLELRELSLAIDTADGIVLVVGCSHPGIDKIVEAAASIDQRIHLIVGGFHLVAAKDEEIESIVVILNDNRGVKYVAPGHCTGEPTFTALKRAFGERYLYAGLGNTIALGAIPRSLAGSAR